MRRLPALIVTVATVAALAACGGDDDTTTSAGAEPGDCVGSFTGTARPTFAELAALSHDPKNQVTVGRYTGEQFSAESYDNGTAGDGSEVTVATNACVITEVSKEFGPLYLFVQTTEGGWHRLLESDPEVPLVPDPESQLTDVQQVEIEEIGG